MAKAIFGDGLGAWSVGVIAIAYDVALLAFVAWQARAIWRDEETPAADAAARRPTLGVIIAAYNEAPALAATIDALLAQTDPPDAIWLADDGSQTPATPFSPNVTASRPRPAEPSPAEPVAPTLRWLRLAHRGKAHALNAALAHADTEVVLTVDADTLLAPDAIAVVRRAFAADPTSRGRRRRAEAALRGRRARPSSCRSSRPTNMSATSSAATPGRGSRACC